MFSPFSFVDSIDLTNKRLVCTWRGSWQREKRRRRENDLLAIVHPLFPVCGEIRPNVRYPSFRFYSQKLSIETGLQFDHHGGFILSPAEHLAFPSIHRHTGGTGSTRRRDVDHLRDEQSCTRLASNNKAR